MIISSLLGFLTGLLIGLKLREIEKGIIKIQNMLNVKENSAVIRGKDIITQDRVTPNEGRIVKPMSPKEAAREAMSRFNKRYDL